jgi:hypothetical protein
MFWGSDKGKLYAHSATATKPKFPCASPLSNCGTNAIESYLFDLLGQGATSAAANGNSVLWEIGDPSFSHQMS